MLFVDMSLDNTINYSERAQSFWPHNKKLFEITNAHFSLNV